jgi:hypothetical protein
MQNRINFKSLLTFQGSTKGRGDRKKEKNDAAMRRTKAGEIRACFKDRF